MDNKQKCPKCDSDYIMPLGSSISRGLMNASIFLALITSLLYISGSAYIASYISEWGIESSLFSSNTQEVLVHGSTIWFVGGVQVVSLAIVISLLISLVFLFVSEIAKISFIRKWASKSYLEFKSQKNKELVQPSWLSLIARWIFQFIMLIISLSVFLFVFYGLIVFSSSLAKERAHSEYQLFSTGQISNSKIFSRQKTITINGIQQEGYVLVNTSDLIALYLLPTETRGDQVLIVPLSSVSEIRATEH